MIKEKIQHATFIKASPEKVYDTITSAREWDAFFTTGMGLEPKEGGKIIFRWKDWGPDLYTGSADGNVLAAEEPNRFVFEWFPTDKEHPTTITFALKGGKGGTTVRLTEEGYSDTDKGRCMILECAAGWGEALTLLKFYIEHGITYTGPER
jgi:uncharacterized protein YndB with AHSA1/START domain